MIQPYTRPLSTCLAFDPPRQWVMESATSDSQTGSIGFADFTHPNELSKACVVSLCFSQLFEYISTEPCLWDTTVLMDPADLSLSVVPAPPDAGRLSSIPVKVVRAISRPVPVNLGSTVSSCMNGSPTPRARRTAGMITVELHTAIDTAASTPPRKEVRVQ